MELVKGAYLLSYQFCGLWKLVFFYTTLIKDYKYLIKNILQIFSWTLAVQYQYIKHLQR
jgi:hypothetical protein